MSVINPPCMEARARLRIDCIMATFLSPQKAPRASTFRLQVNVTSGTKSARISKEQILCTGLETMPDALFVITSRS